MGNKIIKTQVRNAEIKQALENLIVFTENTEHFNTAVKLSQRFKQLEIKTSGRLFERDVHGEYDNIVLSILSILDEVEKNSGKKMNTLQKKINLLVKNKRELVDIIIILIFFSPFYYKKIECSRENYYKSPNGLSPKKIINKPCYLFKFVDFDSKPYINGALFVNGHKIIPDTNGVFLVPKNCLDHKNKIGVLKLNGIPCYNRELPIPNSSDSIILIKTSCL